jgi:putative nucleotidyltransferase with HDIG domain
MEQARPRILVVDDEQAFAQLVAELLTEKGYETTVAHDLVAARAAAKGGGYDAAVLDLVLPGGSGLEVLPDLREGGSSTQVLILTGQGGKEAAIAGIRHGVFDYLEKAGLDLDRLERRVGQAVERARLLRQNQALVSRLEESNRLMLALQQESARLGEEPHLDRLLPRLVEAAKSLVGGQRGRVLLFQRASGSEVLVVETSIGDDAEQLRGVRLQQGEGIAASAAQQGRSYRFDDPTREARFTHRCDDLGSGVRGWLAAPLRKGSVLGALVVGGRPGGFGPEHESLLASLARQAALLVDNALEHDRSMNFFAHVSDLLVQVLERLDVYYPGHSRRVAALADMVSRRLGLDDAERRAIHFGALLHDIGKIRLDPHVLKSNVPLAEAREEIQRHPTLGFEILHSITAWEDILPIVHYHHERWDGAGYPHGLKEEEIPLGARIVGVAEAFDAMTRDTPHGSRKSEADGLRELELHAGSQFDPRVVRIFVTEFRKHGHPFDGPPG